MALLTVEEISRSGLQPTQTAIGAGGDTFVNDGKKTFLLFLNGATAFVLTIVTPGTVDGLAIADRTVSIGANEEHLIGPWPTAQYNDSSGIVSLTYDDTTDGTVSPVRLP